MQHAAIPGIFDLCSDIGPAPDLHDFHAAIAIGEGHRHQAEGLQIAGLTID